MNAARAVVMGAAVALVLTASARASARSCIGHAYEKMELERTGVFIGTRPVAPPPELGAVDQLLNSGEAGKGALLWQKNSMGFAKFYNLAEAWEPAPAIEPWLAATAKRTLMTSCGYAVPYTPILPGRYKFEEEHLDGARVSKGVDDPELLVAPGRDRIELRFSVRGTRYRAAYTVSCASFDWEPSTANQCAISVPSDWPLSVALPDEPATDAPRLADPAPGPAPSVSIESVPVVTPEPQAGRGCGSCAVGGASGASPWLWGLVLGAGLLVRRGRSDKLCPPHVCAGRPPRARCAHGRSRRALRRSALHRVHRVLRRGARARDLRVRGS